MGLGSGRSGVPGEARAGFNPANPRTRPNHCPRQWAAPAYLPFVARYIWDLRFFRMAQGNAKFCMACPLSNASLSFPMAWQNFGPAVCHRQSRYVASSRACWVARDAEGGLEGILPWQGGLKLGRPEAYGLAEILPEDGV